MQILTNKEIDNWLDTRNIADPRKGVSWNKFQTHKSFSIPKDTGRKSAFSKNITPLLLSQTECLIWIYEFGIWPSCENMALFEMFKNWIGDTRSLREAPGHLCSSNDIIAVESLLDLILYFFWGAVIVNSNKRYILNISHDEVIDVGGDKNFVELIKQQIME